MSETIDSSTVQESVSPKQSKIKSKFPPIN
jgi:hypothetical protein